MYPIVFLDALRVNSLRERTQREQNVLALAINNEGIKDVLGIYLQENREMSFWMSGLS